MKTVMVKLTENTESDKQKSSESLLQYINAAILLLLFIFIIIFIIIYNYYYLIIIITTIIGIASALLIRTAPAAACNSLIWTINIMPFVTWRAVRKDEGNKEKPVLSVCFPLVLMVPTPRKR